MLDFVYENQTTDQKWSEQFFVNIFEHSFKHLGLGDKQIELGLHLILPDRSQGLNREHRHKDRPTDVLSFPLDEHSLEKYGILPIGDIFICLEVAERQAEEINIPIDQEMARLAVHGLLHLLGYDHETSSEDEKKMIDLQEDIIATLPKS
ncbi:MAG: rRNA maturation RNase YbeY [Candidatus Pacebacteria bacterium]|nr:rRNA maturation RNase YbeY [Candidatus Paceibacterota bacterium]